MQFEAVVMFNTNFTKQMLINIIDAQLENHIVKNNSETSLIIAEIANELAKEKDKDIVLEKIRPIKNHANILEVYITLMLDKHKQLISNIGEYSETIANCLDVLTNYLHENSVSHMPSAVLKKVATTKENHKTLEYILNTSPLIIKKNNNYAFKYNEVKEYLISDIISAQSIRHTSVLRR